MNLLQIRQHAVEKSGRYDLVVDTTDYVDNGMNWYIQRGLAYLDLLTNSKQAEAKLFSTFASGSWYVLMENCRAVKDVWVQDDEDRSKLTYATLEDFKGYYPEPVAELDTGAPEHYAIANLRTSPETDDQITLESFVDATVTVASDEHSYDAILIGPPADGSYIIEVEGLFFQTTLSSDAQENYWSVRYPQAVVWAALREIEIDYRNTEGAKDWENAIRGLLQLLDFDAIEQETAEFDHIIG